MEKAKGLVILHVDGLGYAYLQKALQQGQMPFVSRLIEKEGYETLRYRCGVPSTTPFCQAGILYGDNSEIPAFRWWDKQSGLAVSFDGFDSFKKVAHKYFAKCDPLTAGGAAIATCYPESIIATVRPGSREHGRLLGAQSFSQRRVVQSWAMNPIHLVDWLRRGLWEVWKANVHYWHTRLMGRPAARKYVVGDMLEEILLHHLTRFAVIQAMKENFPVIYAALYAYDETAHAFGPESSYAFRILRHVDYTLGRIARERRSAGADAREYEMIILSDHGQMETTPYHEAQGRCFEEVVAEWFPTFDVEAMQGKRITRSGPVDGHVLLAYSGGLAHLYFKDISWRLQHDEIEERFPRLIEKAARAPGIELVLTSDGAHNIITTKETQIKYALRGNLPREACELLARYDEPKIVARQLDKLNSFERAGDLIFFAQTGDHARVNFENQVGGHGSIGGEQSFPFILARREWDFDTAGITDSTGIYVLLRRLCDQFITSAQIKAIK